MAALPEEIRTKRLLLRPVRISDLDDMMEYAGDPEWGRYQGVPQPFLRRHAEQFIRDFLQADWSTNPFWAVEVDGKAVGGLSLLVSREHQTATIGFDLAPRLWGLGLVTEAARAVMAHAFQELGLRKIWATGDAPNAASIRVMEKLGMQREGLQRKHRLVRGEPVDIVSYGILREDWQAPSG